jgi:hypothetical protein
VSARAVLPALLLVVAGSAAVLSFSALRDLALSCGFAPRLAWLLPVVVDAGAAAGSLVWLSHWPATPARRFARALALTLLALSVAANALGHGLEAFSLAPPWWVVVVVSAVAPAVLGAVVHLAVLVGRADRIEPTAQEPADESDTESDSEFLDENGISRFWETAPLASPTPAHDRAELLIAAGVGRRRLSRELGVTEYEARQLLERTRARQDGQEAEEPTEPSPQDDNGTEGDQQK